MKWWTELRKDGNRRFMLLYLTINGALFEVGRVEWYFDEGPFYGVTQSGRTGPMSSLSDAAGTVDRHWFADLKSIYCC